MYCVATPPQLQALDALFPLLTSGGGRSNEKTLHSRAPTNTHCLRGRDKFLLDLKKRKKGFFLL